MSKNLPVDIKDDENEFSIYNLVPGVVQGYIDAIPEELWELSPKELEEQGQINEVDRKCKLNFWMEFERACRNKDHFMRMTHVYKGVCSQPHFLRRVINNSFKLAYILTPFEDIALTQEDLLRVAYQKEAEVLALPLTKKTVITKENGDVMEFTEVDAKLASVVSKIRESLENRKFGSHIHRSQQVNRNINENYNHSSPVLPFDMAQLSQMKPEQLEAVVRALTASNADMPSTLVIEGMTTKDDNKG